MPREKREIALVKNVTATQNKTDILNELWHADPKSEQIILHHVTVLSIEFSVTVAHF
jgi:hypothetical protein